MILSGTFTENVIDLQKLVHPRVADQLGHALKPVKVGVRVHDVKHQLRVRIVNLRREVYGCCVGEHGICEYACVCARGLT